MKTIPDSTQSERELLRRLLALVWQYRWGCMVLLGLQIALLALGLSGLGLTGIGVDFLRHVLAERNGISRPPPAWLFGLAPPNDWKPEWVLSVLAGMILGMAGLRALLNMTYTIFNNYLLQAKVVVKLRSDVYAKLQQLSFTFFDANASGGLINRVTGDVQGLRSFIDGVFIQSSILILTLIVYLIYMLSIHVWLTLACLASTPLLWLITVRYSKRVRLPRR